ncbi:hypothetical protein TrVFT333_003641 [Trichoderma virens FT-333]|nr:hypothetical protein TrVFT333_003641 [Trichoderma virens FT-333]
MLILAFLPVVIALYKHKQEYCSVYAVATDCRPPPDDFLHIPAGDLASDEAKTEILEDAFSALAVLQNEYYQIGRNTWPSSIDWTAAVTETVVSGMLSTLTKSLDMIVPGITPSIREAQENLISSVYDQVIGYHFAQDIVAIRDQAFDDILWVVLGWIEAINFARSHDSIRFPQAEHSPNASFPTDIHAALASLPWRGQFWIPSFQSRAKSFWFLGSQGWDTALCHGGMVWNPRLEPYKNAITNELYISASISMYQYISNGSVVDKDPRHLQAAIEGYKWLVNSNMTNSEGLWDVTGSPSYLEDGHDLIQAVINATGWSLKRNQPIDLVDASAKLPKWRGLGRGGILEEQCDASGTCSQDSQTFKGIYFHHLNAFCRPLEQNNLEDGDYIDMDGFTRVQAAHKSACRAYLGWIKHNALAALKTRDSRGRFGMWWGSGIFGNIDTSPASDGIDHDAVNITDYRGLEKQVAPEDYENMVMLDSMETPMAKRKPHPSDPNNRGRGRTVETQVGGVAVLRAYWDISQSLSS